MSHLYPIAASAQDAIDPENPAALTRADAVRLAGDGTVVTLQTEWLTLPPQEAGDMLDKAEASEGHGFVQLYENSDGHAVLAITYWQVSKAEITPEPSPAAQAQNAADAEEDHTDDLYFRSGRTKKRNQAPKIDPRQMDLFQAPSEPE